MAGADTGKHPHPNDNMSGHKELNDEDDDRVINSLLSGEDPNQSLAFLNRELEPGEKANDAVDYEDIDDDDLADDEDEQPAQRTQETQNDQDELGDIFGEGPLGDQAEDGVQEKDGFDDLFGDMPSSPLEADQVKKEVDHEEDNHIDTSFDLDNDELLPESSTSAPAFSPTAVRPPSSTKEQEALLGISELSIPPPPPESHEELLASLWPTFERDSVPFFLELLPSKRAHYVGKTPLKAPRPVHPTKLNLELSEDQEKSFRLGGAVNANKRGRDVETDHKGLVPVIESEQVEESDGAAVDLESPEDDEMVGGISWEDLEVLCEDWEVPSADDAPSPKVMIEPEPPRQLSEEDELFGVLDEEEDDYGAPPAKRLKSNNLIHDMFSTPQFSLPPFEDPERMTANIAKAVTLDLNDPQLLIDILETTAPTRRPRAGMARGISRTYTKDISKRYNISNDDAYDLLKENHQNKIRSTLGNLTIEHSMPAVKLQYPYYKVKLHTRDARSFHRPAMLFQPNATISFSKTRSIKKKLMRGKDALTTFPTAKDLSLADNSSSLLLEYSEEHPTMMSNFGMGSRLINYYRRKNAEDTSRPKGEIGETAILLPQDKSPFSVFGNVEPGQMMPTLYNAMYRAPLFQQQPKSSDFLVIRNTTGVNGSTWFMRNIDNLFVVGQEFPSVDVPGPHSRKVTTASKNRLKMISYRKIKKNNPHRINVSEITEHFPDTTDMQNRQKMKEFMQFSKEHKLWEMRPGEEIPEEDVIRTMVKPEDVCLLESMQVGLRHLQDAGYAKEDDESESDDGKEGQSLEQQLAPWNTTRNFLNATQGKAMLQLHGEGDPSGRGEAFSFIRTSMKGGFRAIGESIEEKLESKKSKDAGGHSYNVAKQQRAYEESIKRIWEAQKQSLSSTAEHSDTDMDDHATEAEDLFVEGRTPRSEIHTPAPHNRRDDETGSQFSRFSSSSQSGKVLRITRDYRDKHGRIESREEVIRDPKVIREYMRRRRALEADNLRLSDLKPTGDLEQDRRAQKRLEEELARLERNKERRIARDKQKGIFQGDAAGSPNSPNSPAVSKEKPLGTQRKCANCGQVGHIKTNKKLCPLLNGTMKQEDTFTDSAFSSSGPPALP